MSEQTVEQLLCWVVAWRPLLLLMLRLLRRRKHNSHSGNRSYVIP